ncbi:Foldase protein PrsA precursor [Thermogutta terrifontis]|jgi:parvulin-like peptidyl-prolyl isomerase|uniref:peptidylprolyl isomerase n=1 Tax=Thermogutta terrifontis TaxID=1331910 RepID=A0A286R9L7_9BACT|nr:peptidylprolyl isomerase [Thermogutta terrifontis]ASV72655.1 Foldase protein PrsA precursor [Thermogutta terrifontis]
MQGKEFQFAGKRHIRWKLVLGVLGIVGAAVAIRWFWGSERATAQAPGPGSASTARSTPEAIPAPAPRGNSGASQAPGASGAVTSQPSQPQIVAVVNGEPITRDELRRECLRRYGEEVLESVVNKYLIMEECQRRGITVTAEEIDAEITRMATRFGMPVEAWLKLLKDERGIKPEQYRRDIIWPMLALRKLAGQKLLVTPEELQREFESRYGPAVKARMIVVSRRDLAERLRNEAVAHPDQFGDLAKQYSEDAASASLKGLIQPIRKHVGQKEIEDVAFGLKPGEISPVIPVANQFVILKCEDQLPAVKVRLEDVRAELEEMARDAKLRTVAQEIFQELQKRAQVVNVLNDPQKRQQMPGVAALINGRPIRLEDLGEICIDRHGEEVLELTINRKLIEQACKKRGITITDADVEAEIARLASQNLPPRADGKPDVERWVDMICEQQKITPEIYRHDLVWPTVALKKLVNADVQVTDEDLKKAFEANYGPRVRCRAIVLNNLRRAQQVWEKARANPTEENFADLAEQYSIDPATRALRGEVAPIQKHGGQPNLEEEAFSLKPGEISGIIQVGPETYVILYCLGFTKPVDVDFASVKDILTEDIREKKLRLAMADYFDKLRAAATIDNFLAGTTQSPNLTRRAAGMESTVR